VIEESLRDERLLPLARARMFTYYPATQSARKAGRLQTLSERFPVRTLAVPFWPVLQAFGRDLIAGSPHPDLVAPTSNELRFSLMSALMAGARGVFFYPYMHATRYDAAKAAGGWAYVDYRPLPQLAPGLWRSVLDTRAAAAELLDLLRTAAPDSSVSATLPPAVEMRSWKTNRGLLILVANATYEPQRIGLRVEPEKGRVLQLVGSAGETGAAAEKRFSGQAVDLELSGPDGIALLVMSTP
jgi:hypothetical protein